MTEFPNIFLKRELAPATGLGRAVHNNTAQKANIIVTALYGM